MALIPLKQTVIHGNPEMADDYGYPLPGATVTLKCRFEERTDEVLTPRGEEVTTMGRFYFDKNTQIGYDDVLRYTDEFNKTVAYQPKLITPIRGLNGKRVLLRVDV